MVGLIHKGKYSRNRLKSYPLSLHSFAYQPKLAYRNMAHFLSKKARFYRGSDIIASIF